MSVGDETMSVDIPSFNRARRLRLVLLILLIPLLVESLLLFLSALGLILSTTWLQTMLDTAVVLSILFVLGSLILVATSTARENAVQDFRNKALIRLPVTVEDQLELRRKAIRNEGRSWGISIILFGESAALFVMNGVLLLTSRWLIIPALLILLGLVVVLIYKRYQLSSMLSRPSGKFSSIRRKK